MTIDDLYNIIEESLFIEKKDINEDTSTENVSGWDSLGHITLLSMLVEILEESFSSEEAVEHAIFLKRIVELLERYAE